MQFNMYNMYSYIIGSSQTEALDEVDACRLDLSRMTEYDDVKNFLIHKFGEIDGEHWIGYPELNKKVYIYIDDTKVEYCALKNNTQYWGRGWRLEEVNENTK